MVVVVALLVLNLGTLGYLFWSGRPGAGGPQHPPRPDKLIIERLKLDDAQIETFEGLKHEHHSGIVRLNKKSKTLYESYFALLKTETPDLPSADSIERLLGAVQQQKDSITFDHFIKLRQLCNADQKPLFDDFVDELGEILSRQPGPGKRPRH